MFETLGTAILAKVSPKLKVDVHVKIIKESHQNAKTHIIRAEARLLLTVGKYLMAHKL